MGADRAVHRGYLLYGMDTALPPHGTHYHGLGFASRYYLPHGAVVVYGGYMDGTSIPAVDTCPVPGRGYFCPAGLLLVTEITGMQYLEAIRQYKGLPEWIEMVSLLVWYAFSGVATLYFTLLIPIWLQVEGVERYTRPLAKGAYKAGTWLAPIHAFLQCLRFLGAVLYLLV